LTECARIFAQNDLLQKSQGTPQLGLELAMLACVEIHRHAQDNPAQNAQPRAGSPSQPTVPTTPASTGSAPMPAQTPRHAPSPEMSFSTGSSAEFRAPVERRPQPPTTASTPPTPPNNVIPIVSDLSEREQSISRPVAVTPRIISEEAAVDQK